jgi:hypothetical protein
LQMRIRITGIKRPEKWQGWKLSPSNLGSKACVLSQNTLWPPMATSVALLRKYPLSNLPLFSLNLLYFNIEFDPILRPVSHSLATECRPLQFFKSLQVILLQAWIKIATRDNIGWFHLHEVTRKVKVTRTGSRINGYQVPSVSSLFLHIKWFSLPSCLASSCSRSCSQFLSLFLSPSPSPSHLICCTASALTCMLLTCKFVSSPDSAAEFWLGSHFPLAIFH